MKDLAFLFTDIEGSTSLWERHPATMPETLARHDAIMRRSIEAYEGVVFKTIGDAFCAVFTNSADALYAAVHAQQELASQDWGEIEPIRVRMAIHRGAVTDRDGDYFGPTLNRIARLVAAGHGGQILLSRQAVEDVGGRMPPGGRLIDLGEHRLKDLVRSEHIAQYADDVLASEFPALQSLNTCANNLPIQLTSFVGREREVVEIRTLLAGSRLVTLCGAGGSGKTRLALQAAAEVVDEYAHGAWFVELAPVTDPQFVPHAMASALRLREEAGQSIQQTLIAFLRTKSVLVVLDNCEHLVDAAAIFAQNLLQSCPNLKIIATSREGLNIPGEKTWRVPSLALPPVTQTYDPNEVAQYSAVRLFVDRASGVDPSFTLNSANVASVVAICRRLDGIPLAIELATARIRILSPEEIALRLDDRFQLLTGGSRTALPRHQTLRATIDWSYQLLGGLEGLLFRRLSAFIGGFTLETAQSVCGADLPPLEVLDCLCRLVDKSLVIADDEEGNYRYRLLETIQEYAAEKLQQSGESEAIRRRHMEFFLKLAEQAAAEFGGADQGRWYDRLARDHDNIRAALTGNTGNPEDEQKLLRMSCCLARFWMVRGHWQEGLTRLKRALESSETNPADRAQALNACGHLACQLGDYASAESSYLQSLELRRGLNDKRGIAAALNNLGLVHFYREDFTGALPLFSESLELFRSLGEQRGAIGAVLNNLGTIMHNLGDYAAAESQLQEALQISKDLGDHLSEAAYIAELGRVAWRRGDLPLARRLLEDALQRFRQLGEKLGGAEALQSLGDVAASFGQKDLARSYYEESLTICRSLFARRNVEKLTAALAQTFSTDDVETPGGSGR